MLTNFAHKNKCFVMKTKCGGYIFKKVCRKHNTELDFAQEAGDYIYYENTFQGNKKSVHLSNDEIAMWMRDW